MDASSINSTPSPSPTNYFPCLRPIYEKIASLVKEFFSWMSLSFYGPPRPKEPFYDAARFNDANKKVDLLRDTAQWVQIDNFVKGIVNLGPNENLLNVDPSIRVSPFMQVGYYQSENYLPARNFLSVCLPRRQIIYFPKLLQEHLLQFTEDQLELQFIIFQKPLSSSADFSLIFHHLFFPDYPQLREVTKSISTGLFGGSGIKRGTGRSISWGTIQKNDIKIYTDGASYFHSPNNQRVQMDGKVGTFYVGASFADCNDTTKIKAYGVMGIVLGLDDEIDVSNPALEISQRLVESKTLKEFVEGCGGRSRNFLHSMRTINLIS